jgi:hypothetical protein
MRGGRHPNPKISKDTWYISKDNNDTKKFSGPWWLTPPMPVRDWDDSGLMVPWAKIARSHDPPMHLWSQLCRGLGREDCNPRPASCKKYRKNNIKQKDLEVWLEWQSICLASMRPPIWWYTPLTPNVGARGKRIKFKTSLSYRAKTSVKILRLGTQDGRTFASLTQGTGFNPLHHQIKKKNPKKPQKTNQTNNLSTSWVGWDFIWK